MTGLWRTLRAAILIVLVPGVCTPDGGGSGNEYKLLMPGEFDSSRISYGDGDVWYALFKADSGYVLEEVEVQAEPCPIPYKGKPGDLDGVRITLDHPQRPLIMISGPGKLEGGSIQTVFSGDKFITVGASIRFGLEVVITAMGRVTDEGMRHPSDLVTLDYQVMILQYPFSRADRQIILEHDRTSAESTPSLLWAGDLDRDGKTDLLLDMTDHYNVRHYGLFLSSEAEAGQLVKLVADLRLVGC